MQARVLLWEDIGNGVVIKSLVFAVLANWIALFEGYEATTDLGRGQSGDHPNRGGTSLAVLGWDFVLTALMFGVW